MYDNLCVFKRAQKGRGMVASNHLVAPGSGAEPPGPPVHWGQGRGPGLLLQVPLLPCLLLQIIALVLVTTNKITVTKNKF